MVFKAENHVTIQTKDILSWYFDEPQFDLDQTVYLKAEDTSQHYTGRQAYHTIRKLIAGFRAHGLQKGDCVCLNSFNDVRIIQMSLRCSS